MFPAYGEESPPHFIAPPDEESDFSGRFSSFSSKTKEKNGEKEEKKREREERKAKRKSEEEKQREKERLLSEHSIKMIGIDSDDCSDIDVPMNFTPAARKTKRKKHSKRSKKKRRRKESESSSSSSESSDSSSSSSNSTASSCEHRSPISVPQYLCSGNRWSFMVEFNPSNSKSFMIMDLKGDRTNAQFDSLYRADVPSYEFPLQKVLGGDENLEKFRFGTREKKETFERYFSNKVVKMWNKEPEKFWRKKELKPFIDYIELSRVPLSENDLRDESGNLSLEKCSAVHGGKALFELTPEIRNRNYNAELGRDSSNIELWFKFLAVQDELFLSQNDPESRAKNKSTRLTNRELLDRKMSILDKAISLNNDCVKLKLERLKIGMLLWEEDVWEREIRQVEFRHVNDPEMWEGVLDLLESDTRRFSLDSQLRKMKICLKKLDEIRNGTLLSHKELPNTEQFMASVILRRIRLLSKTGYIEKAIASSQAVCEFNLCTPESFKNANTVNKRKLFEVFWDSGIARIGDEGAEGWAVAIEHIREGNVMSDLLLCEKEQKEYEKMEEELCSRAGSKGLKMPYRLIWIELERLRTQYQWRPVRDLNAPYYDRERFVAFQDIEDVLYMLSEPVAIDLLYEILEEFGAAIYGRNSMRPANIMQQFTIFPNLTLQLKGFDSFVNRFIELARKYVPQISDLLLSSELTTILNFLKRDGLLNDEMCSIKFREKAKNLCYQNLNSGNLSFMATFVELLLTMGKKETVIRCATKLFTENMWNDRGSTRLNSLLRLAISYISALEDEHMKRCAIADFVMEGRLAEYKEMESAEIDAVKIEEQASIRLNNVLKNVRYTYLKETWEGSTVDLSATLVLLFAYYFADDAVRLNNLKRCFTSLSKTLANHPQLQFMKKYIELLRLYMASHPCVPRRLLIDGSAMAYKKYPTEVSFLKSYIDSSAVGRGIIDLRRYLETDVRDRNENYCLAFASVYLELWRHRMLLETNDFQSPELHRLRSVVMKSSERISHREDDFWRLLLFIENERKDVQRASEVFYLAYAHCPWSKALILDHRNVNAGEHEKLLDALVEKRFRVRCEQGEVAILVR